MFGGVEVKKLDGQSIGARCLVEAALIVGPCKQAHSLRLLLEPNVKFSNLIEVMRQETFRPS